MNNKCECTEEDRDLVSTCGLCQGTGESGFSPDHPCSSCRGSGEGDERVCLNCELEYE